MVLKFSSARGVAMLGMALVLVAGSAGANTVHDVTTAGSSANLGNGLFIQVNPQPTGTGYVDPFVQINPGGGVAFEHAYNTTVNGVLDTNGPSDNFNHAIQLFQIEIVTVDGVDYRRFILDINEVNNGTDNFLSLDEVQIFAGGPANDSSEAFTPDGFSPTGVLDLTGGTETLIWRLDDGMDNTILMDYDLNNGSGTGDYELLVENSVFAGLDATTNIVFYSAFGAYTDDSGRDWGGSDGFEEWWVQEGNEPPPPPGVIPEPATIGLLGLGLAGVALRRRVRA